jgi:hypothetical protein
MSASPRSRRTARLRRRTFPTQPARLMKPLKLEDPAATYVWRGKIADSDQLDVDLDLSGWRQRKLMGAGERRAIRILATTYHDLNLEPTFTNMCICQKKTGRF